MEIFLTPDFIKFFIPLVGAVIAWYINERRKRSLEEYQKKEERYRELLRAIKGFYTATSDNKLKDEFLEQIKLCWLYCPDDVIKNGYSFLNSVRGPNQTSNQDKELLLGNFIAAIRYDLLSRKITRKTSLNGNDYQHLYVKNDLDK